MMYCIVGDDDGHDYVIPWDKTEEFHKWVDNNALSYGECDYEQSLEVLSKPKWAYEIGGSPSCVVFPSYEIK